MHQQCPYIYPIELLARKWTYFVLRTLRKPQTFSEIKAELRFVTNRMLSIELRTLSEQEIIGKKDNTYELTVAGKELLEAIEPLVDWTTKHKGALRCPTDQGCQTCANYPSTVDVRDFNGSQE